MTECEKMRNDLKAYLDGQLSPAVRIAVRLHLNRCESCRKEMEEMRLMGTRMRAADSLEMSDALRTRILAAVPKTAPDARVPMRPTWREKPVILWGASASAALAWFIFYPALNNYQNHAIRTSNATSFIKPLGIGMAGQQYTQDYDEVAQSRARLYNGLVAHGSGAFSTQDPTRPSKAPALDGYQVTHAGLSVNGKAPQTGGHGGENILNQLQVMQGDRTLAGAYKDAHVPSPPYVFSDSEPVRLSRDTVHIARDSADAGHTTPSEITTIAKAGAAQTQIAQGGENGRYEKAETDPSRSRASAPINEPNATSRAQKSDPFNHAWSVIPARPSEHMKTLIGDDLPTERQVHKDASLTVEVANAEQQSESVERLVKESKGYVAQNQLTTGEDNTRTASLTCKVPVDQFDTVMGQITRLGLLKGKTLTGEDITDKVSDEQETGHVLRADIATTEEKLKVRRRHSETVRDEETLRSLRIRAAQSQARLKMLTRLGALAEITVELDEKPKNAPVAAPKPVSPFMEEVSGTGQAAAHSFLMALRLPVQLLVWVVVYAPLWFLLYIGYRRFTR